MSTAIQFENWRPRAYASGTHIVDPMNGGKDAAWLWILHINPVDIDAQQDRWVMCEQLAAYLNGGLKPGWLDDMNRVSEEKLVGVDGSIVEAQGPLFDADPPRLNWQTRMDDEAKNARARLIDRVCG